MGEEPEPIFETKDVRLQKVSREEAEKLYGSQHWVKLGSLKAGDLRIEKAKIKFLETDEEMTIEIPVSTKPLKAYLVTEDDLGWLGEDLDPDDLYLDINKEFVIECEVKGDILGQLGFLEAGPGEDEGSPQLPLPGPEQGEIDRHDETGRGQAMVGGDPGRGGEA